MSNSHSDDPSIDEAPLLHVDLDAFFASVEILDDPSLRGRPVCVGGAGERGVIASASYEARRFGVRSAMPTVTAKRLCPALVVLPGRFDRYEEYSAKFHQIVNDVTPLFEPISLDEVFADLRGLSSLGVRPLQAARNLRQRLMDELRLDSGIGVARNKLFAKLASKESKPNVVNGKLLAGAGVVWVSPALEQQWLNELPVRALWGVGPATAKRLNQLGLRMVRDLLGVDQATLAHHFGPAMAAMLTSYAQGEDLGDVVVQRAMKSLGHDQTFGQSLVGLEALRPKVLHHAGVVARALRGRGQVARTVTIGVRFDDLSMVQRSQSLPFGIDAEGAIAAVGMALLESVNLVLPVRLLALHLSSFVERDRNEVQLSFGMDDDSTGRSGAVEASRSQQVANEALRDTLDEIRQRYGVDAVGLASELRFGIVDVAVQRGRHAFGPDAREE